VAKTKSGTAKKPSQMGMVRDALQDIGDVKPLEMQSHIKSKHGVELPANIISNYKSQIKRKNGAGAGRGKKQTLQIEDFEVVRKLVNRLGAEQVKRLIDVVG
jgi:hypothetical protein